MALLKGTNSYATAAEADNYFADRFNSEAWVNASSTEKEQALVLATSIIDLNNFKGIIRDTDQDLAFPRVGQYFNPKFGFMVDFDDTVPTDIIKAVYELALHLLNNPDLMSDTGSVQQLKVDVIELRFINKPDKMSSQAFGFLSPYLLNNGANLWWRAN